MQTIVRVGKKVKKALRGLRKQEVWLSPVRRIDHVKTDKKVCAMTFDDGPSAESPSEGGERALTDVILDTLAEYGARATFDVVGDTAENYPDEAGWVGDITWGGVKYDHYPDINLDHMGGAVHCPRLIKRMLDEGHEIANHGYRHVLFGKKPFVYGKRVHFENIDQVVSDLGRLHSYFLQNFGYEMKLSRPPHYVDRISAGLSAYDAYALMGYQYMGASLDGGGWLPEGSYEAEVESMVRVIEEKPLSGRIIFQKDGKNMARRTPVADGLAKQLERISSRGYRVVTVSELLDICPFSDISPKDSCFEAAKALLEAGYVVCYRDNTVRPDSIVTRGEFAAMTADRGLFTQRIKKLASEGSRPIYRDVPTAHPYSLAIRAAVSGGILTLTGGKLEPARPLCIEELESFAEKHGLTPPEHTETVRKSQVLAVLYEYITCQ